MVKWLHKFLDGDKENGGVSSARNIGLDNATGKYIMFADADDRIEQNAADILLNCRESTNADLVVCGYYRDDEKVYYKGKSVKFLPRITAAQAIAGRYKYVLGYLWNKLFSKEIIDNTIFFLKIWHVSHCFYSFRSDTIAH